MLTQIYPFVVVLSCAFRYSTRELAFVLGRSQETVFQQRILTLEPYHCSDCRAIHRMGVREASWNLRNNLRGGLANCVYARSSCSGVCFSGRY